MLTLTREVRFAVNTVPDAQLSSSPSNSFGGYPSLTGAGQYFQLQVSLSGALDSTRTYLLNIKDVDNVVRREAIPLVAQRIRDGEFGGGAGVLRELFEHLRRAWGAARLTALRLNLSPTLSLEIRELEQPMVRVTQKFEFSASHRLFDPNLTDEQNHAAFGKCSNPHGHGHNYELAVTVRGEPDRSGSVANLVDFERVVSHTVIERFDHKNLNVEIPEFREINPSVENIAAVIYRLLKPALSASSLKLASVTVWETPKTWCEYSE